VSLKLIKLGGPLPLVRAGRLALQRGLKINLACKVAETSVSAAATAHCGVALRDVAWGFSMSSRYLAQDVCEPPLIAEGGAVQEGQLARPGLGVKPDAERLQAFASPDLPARTWPSNGR
jgi:L-alanine-DL-glutamate epimerase-like enolase superfamily enzyme